MCPPSEMGSQAYYLSRTRGSTQIGMQPHDGSNQGLRHGRYRLLTTLVGTAQARPPTPCCAAALQRALSIANHIAPWARRRLPSSTRRTRPPTRSRMAATTMTTLLMPSPCHRAQHHDTMMGSRLTGRRLTAANLHMGELPASNPPLWPPATKAYCYILNPGTMTTTTAML